MNRKLAFTLLALTVVLGGAGTAFAAHHKNPAEPIDPRLAYKWEGTRSQTWCDTNPECNGWSKWLTEVQEGKLKVEPGVLVGR